MMCWDRLSPDARASLMLAHGEADRLGHSYEGGEHVLLGLLARGGTPAARLLTGRGLDLNEARAEVGRIVAETTRPDGAAALRALGIDVAEIRRRLEAGFGAVAVREATWQVARRPWWRGGGRATTLWRKPVLYKRSLELAVRLARRHGTTPVTTEHLLCGVLTDARDPLGTGISRRGRRNVFAQTGLREGAPHPIRLLLDTHDIDIDELIAQTPAG